MRISLLGIKRRINLLLFKLHGKLPGVKFSQCIKAVSKNTFSWAEVAIVLSKDIKAGIVEYKIPLHEGAIWMPDIDIEYLELDMELLINDYYHGAYIGNLISAGDVVIDCGGYVGLFALWSLKKGASKVIVFEPMEKNIECIKRNLTSEIELGKVVILDKGIWKDERKMNFYLNDNLNDSTLVADDRNDNIIEIGVTTIDNELKNLKIEEVNLIKMDIEGAEREAIIGAKDTLNKYQPNLAICTYHLNDDRQIIPTRLFDLCDKYKHEMIWYSKKSTPSIDLWYK